MRNTSRCHSLAVGRFRFKYWYSLGDLVAGFVNNGIQYNDNLEVNEVEAIVKFLQDYLKYVQSSS